MAHDWQFQAWDGTVCKLCGLPQNNFTAGTNCIGITPKPATTEPRDWQAVTFNRIKSSNETQKMYNRYMSAVVAHSAEKKEAWIEAYILLSGTQWTDPKPTREEAEAAWAEMNAPDPMPEPTTEPPEWKGWHANLEKAEAAEIECPGCGGEGGWDECVSSPDWKEWRRCSTCDGHGLIEPTPSPLDRALEDFMARRERKRVTFKPDTGNTITHGPGEPDRTYRQEMYALDAAMSQPIAFTARLGGRFP